MKTLLIIATCFLITTGMVAQNGSNPFYKKDFLYANQVYKMQVKSTENNDYVFCIQRDNETQEFTQFSLNDRALFYRNFVNSVSNINGSLNEGISIKSDSLNRILVNVLDSIRANANYIVRRPRKDSIERFIGEIVQRRGCAETYKQLPLTDTLLAFNNNSVYFLKDIKGNCFQNAIFTDENSSNEMIQLADRLIMEVQKSNVVGDASNASLSGRIYLEPASIPVRTLSIRSREILKFEREDPSWELDKHINNRTVSDYERLAGKNGLISEEDLGFGDASKPIYRLVVDSVQCEFEKGKLQNIKVVGTVNGEVEIFENRFPISYSTKSDINKSSTLYSVRNLNYSSGEIELGDVMYFDYHLSLNNEYYAPKDQVLYVYPNSKQNVLLKEKTTEILKARIFTDLIGISDDKPNGILQLEVEKNIILNSKPRPLGKKGKVHVQPFPSVTPIVTLNKVEEDDRILTPLLIDDSLVVGSVDLLRYRANSVGLELDFVKVAVLDIHSEFSVLGGLNIGAVPLSRPDSLTRALIDNDIDNDNIELASDLNLTTEWSFGFDWSLQPSDKYGFTLGYRRVGLKLNPTDGEQPVYSVDNLEDISTRTSFDDNYGNQAILHRFALEATGETSDKGRVFFRATYDFSKNQSRQNFSQIMVGYSYSIFGK